MSWSDTVATVAMLAFVAFIAWVCARPRTTRGDDKHLRDLGQIVTELTALRDQLKKNPTGDQ
ncbi:hypothetical protein OHQ88_10630 [Micromonospora zamorensis]|uniref:hypothetical protein n=1 Tax=Micromonospora zamorensis TaxID=709883 RepID=UPI002E226575